MVQSILNALTEFPDMEWVFIDGSYVKVHQHAAATVGEAAAVGHSRGGNSTKIHLAVDACGNPVGFKVTSGTVNDITAAPELLDSVDLSSTEVLTADKGYDSDAFRQLLADMGIRPNIPYKKDRERLNVCMDSSEYHILTTINQPNTQIGVFLCRQACLSAQFSQP
jgi:hypothetical protein